MGWCGPCLGYLHTARLVLGIWRISWGGSPSAQGQEGQAQLTFPLEIRFGRGPVAPGGSQTCQTDGSAEAQRWVFAWCKQVSWQEPVPFGILAGRWAREMALVSAFVPRQAAPCCLGLKNFLPLSSSPPVLQADLLTYNLPDIKSHLLSEHIPSGPSVFVSQTRGLCFAVGLPLCPSSFPPVHVVGTASPHFLPSSVDLLSTLCSG